LGRQAFERALDAKEHAYLADFGLTKLVDTAMTGCAEVA
jgi:hypothetical protein